MVDALGRATAKAHCVGDSDADVTVVEFQTEDAVSNVVGGREDEFVDWVVDFAHTYAAQARTDHDLFVEAFRERPGARGVGHRPELTRWVGPDARREGGDAETAPTRPNRPGERGSASAEDRLSITARRYSPDRGQLL